MIERKFRDMILDRVSIEDVVTDHGVKLARVGRRLRACCPFHHEKTPSFYVDPERGTWHCFGACQTGGNVIDFVMKAENLPYPKAVKQLLKNYLHYNLADAEMQSSPEEEKKEKERQTMFIYNGKLCQFFQQQIMMDTPKAKAAKAYAIQRWGEQYCQEQGIGYAPDSFSALLSWAQKSSLDIDILQQLGVVRVSDKTGNRYSFYRDRLMIPIRDRYSRITGFTARTMDEKEEHIAKYINSTESLIYKKSDSVFGIDGAARQARIEEKMYLVEGGPDVLKLQSIGILNTVASLGGAWTEGQFEQLQRLHVALCFIPDSDVPKAGETLGAGFKNVIKNGSLAVRMGFSVSVREIPNDTGHKEDPDSFIKSKEIFDGMNEEEFILWYARITWRDDFLAEDRQQFIAKLCDLIIYISDNDLQQTYINELVEKYHHKTAWQNGIKSAKRRRQEAISKKTSNGDIDMLRTFGFIERHHCYYGTNKDGAEVKWSNFTLKPLFHIKDDIRPVRIFMIDNDDPEQKAELIELDMDTLTSAKNLRKKLLGIGNYTWLANDDALIMLQTYLARVTETAVEIKQLGWQRQGFFCFCNGAQEDGRWTPVDDMGIIRLKAGKFYLPAMSKIFSDSTELYVNERKFIHQNYSNISLYTYFKKIVSVFGDNAKVGLCFYLATLFRDIIKPKARFFPILNIFGPKGSGKTELAETLMSFFSSENEPQNIETASVAALADAVASVSNALVHIDEYKNSIDIKKVEWVKDIWGGIGRSRMNMDKDKKREQARVDSGVILTGQEMPTSDIALFTRLIFLTYDKQHHTAEERERFNDLMHDRLLGATHITLQILKHRDSFEASFGNAWKKAETDITHYLHGMEIMDRIERNWLVPLAAYLALEQCIDIPFSYDDLLQICISGIKRQNDLCKNTDEVATFWNIISSAQQKGFFREEQDYLIKVKETLHTTKVKKPLEFDPPKPVLMIRKNSMLTTYRQLGRQTDEKLLPSESILHYLINSPEYLGKTTNAERFKKFGTNGQPLQKWIDDNGTSRLRTIYDKDRPLCFDYMTLAEKFGIILDSDIEGAQTDGESLDGTDVPY